MNSGQVNMGVWPTAVLTQSVLSTMSHDYAAL